MINRKFFFDHAKQILFGGRFTTNQVAGLTAILNEWETHHAHKDDRWLAYMLGTTHHETDKTMQPIDEIGRGLGKPYGNRLKMAKDRNSNHIPYSDTTELFYGRGFVQLTWYENYDLAGRKLGTNFMHNAAGVKVLSNATKILFSGMMEGWFTGVKLSKYFNSTTDDWKNARRIINGTDKAELIKSHALNYYSCISYT
jgi:putative chitinase